MTDWRKDLPEPKQQGDLLKTSNTIYKAYIKELQDRGINTPTPILFKSMFIGLLWRYRNKEGSKDFHGDVERALNRITELNYARHYKKTEKYKEIMGDIGGAMDALIEDCGKRGQHPDDFSIEY